MNWINHIRPDLYCLTSEAKDAVDSFKKNMESEVYPWFMPFVLSEKNNTKNEASQNLKNSIATSYYHAGTYLKNLLGILIIMQYLLLAPLGILIVSKIIQTSEKFPWSWIFVFLFFFIIILLRDYRVKRRRKILENELLSIHSCGIVWQVVVIAHYLALESTQAGYKHYTQNLTKVAQDISENTFKIHEWLDDKKKDL